MNTSRHIVLQAYSTYDLLEKKDNLYVLSERSLNKKQTKIPVTCYKDVLDILKYHQATLIALFRMHDIIQRKREHTSIFGILNEPLYSFPKNDLNTPFKELEHRILQETDPQKYPRHVANTDNLSSREHALFIDIQDNETLFLYGETDQENITCLPKKHEYFSLRLHKKNTYNLHIENITPQNILEKAHKTIESSKKE